jgi:hypothetical protein
LNPANGTRIDKMVNYVVNKLDLTSSTRAIGGNAVIEQSTHYPKVQGLNPATGTGIDKMLNYMVNNLDLTSANRARGGMDLMFV